MQTLRNLTTQATSPPASAPAASVDFGPARTYVLEYMAALV